IPGDCLHEYAAVSFFRLIIFTETVLGIILFINSEFSFIDIYRQSQCTGGDGGDWAEMIFIKNIK
ncbi:hypothetical protein, partial [Mediterraneibacter gnavus]